MAQNNIHSMESFIDSLLEDHHTTLDNISEHNIELNKTISEMREELSQPPTNSLSSDTTDTVFTIATKIGTRYVNFIRELYYTLITVGIPPEEISTTISTVLNTICPAINTDSLKLPKKAVRNT